ncbi:MAG: helix-turn-helix transcriptional regulator [Candidatus Abyssubacteria bacterium]
MKKRTAKAADILHRRYVKGDPAREAVLEAERVNAHVARIIHDLRNEAGLSQTQLAERVGTTQSVISRLEDAGYRGHSLSLLNRIVTALDKRVVLTVADKEETYGNDAANRR